MQEIVVRFTDERIFVNGIERIGVVDDAGILISSAHMSYLQDATIIRLIRQFKSAHVRQSFAA